MAKKESDDLFDSDHDPELKTEVFDAPKEEGKRKPRSPLILRVTEEDMPDAVDIFSPQCRSLAGDDGGKCIRPMEMEWARKQVALFLSKRLLPALEERRQGSADDLI